MRLDPRIRVAVGVALAILGAAALALSFVLTPTPDAVMVMSNGHRVQTPGDMHAADYAILLGRILGPVAMLAGAYLALRRQRSDPLQTLLDAPPDDGHDVFDDIARTGWRPHG